MTIQVNGDTRLINRNLLYTAVTRAKTNGPLVGDEVVFYDMIQNGNVMRRYSGLKDRIREMEE